MKDDFVSSGRAVSDLKAHLVLTTKYRRQVLTAEMLQRLHEILYNLCQKWNCKLIEFNGLSLTVKQIMPTFYFNTTHR